jgi:hypothetical protein
MFKEPWAVSPQRSPATALETPTFNPPKILPENQVSAFSSPKPPIFPDKSITPPSARTDPPSPSDYTKNHTQLPQLYEFGKVLGRHAFCHPEVKPKSLS